MKGRIKNKTPLWVFTIFAILFSKALIFSGLIAGAFLIPFNEVFTLYHHTVGDRPPYYLLVWANLDGILYYRIAINGYSPSQNPFFPLYPLSISLVSNLTHITPLISALLVSYVSFFAALYVVYRLLIVDKKTFLFKLFLFIILFFPTSLFYGAVYNDSLFFLLATVTIYFARKKKIIWASIFGGLATLARLNGLALIFLILVEAFDIDWKNLNKKKILSLLSIRTIVKSRAYSVIILPLSFISYLIYTEIYFGSWKIIFSSMKIWNQDKITFPLQVVWRYLRILFSYHHLDLVYMIASLELLFVLLYVGLIIYSYKKIRMSYWIFFVVSIIIPSLTGTFQGMPRYGLHLYPFFLSLTLFLDKRSIIFKILYFTISITLLIIYTALFTRGFFVS